jgi:hypothetical protein
MVEARDYSLMRRKGQACDSTCRRRGACMRAQRWRRNERSAKGPCQTTDGAEVASVVGMRSAGLVGWLGSDEGERGYKYSC